MSGRADLYMMLRLIQSGAITVADEALDEISAWRDDAGLVKANLKTPFGVLVGTETAEKIDFDPAGLLAWAQDPKNQAEHEVVPAWTETVIVEHPASVRESLPKWLASKCEVLEDGAILHKPTGEILPFARHVPTKLGWRADLTKEAKRQAAESIRSQLPQLSALVSGGRVALPGSDLAAEVDGIVSAES